MRQILLMIAVIIFGLDALGVWRRWSSVDPLAPGLALGFGAFLV